MEFKHIPPEQNRIRINTLAEQVCRDYNKVYFLPPGALHFIYGCDMEDIPPTAKWANRMLRPLTSVYRRLEKYQEILSFVDTGLKQKEKKDRARSRSCDRATNEPALRLSKVNPRADGDDGYACSEYDGDDPSWVPGRMENRQRIRHKYSTREGGPRGQRRRNRVTIRSPEMPRTLPGAVEIATPLLAGRSLEARLGVSRKISRPDPPSPSGNDNMNSNSSEAIGNDSGNSNARKMRGRESSFPSYHGSWKEALDMSGDTGFTDIARFLDRILIKFLNNTSVNSDSDLPSGRRGARSLLSMAVRRLPEFIAEEQKAQDALSDEPDEDMCDAYFAELEAHYAPSGTGWKPLREAVRSQGIYLVSEILCRGWVTKRVARWLLEACLYHGHIDAFESILSKYLASIHPDDHGYDSPSSSTTAPDDSSSPSKWTIQDETVRPLRIYYFSSSPPGNQCFVYDELAKLLMRRVISPEHMVTISWKSCVDDAIQSLATEDDISTTAGCFIEAVILSASGVYTTNTSANGPSDSFALNQPRRRSKRGGPKAATAATTARSSRVAAKDTPWSPDPVIQECLNNLTLSLIAALSSMHVVRSHVPEAADGVVVSTKMRELIRYLSLAVQRDIEIRSNLVQHDVPAFHSLQRGYVLLGECLLQSVETSTPTPTTTKTTTTRRQSGDMASVQNLETFCLVLANHRETVKELANLVLQVISCYERASKYNGIHVFEEVRIRVSRLLRLSDIRGLSTLLGKVAVETAMTLAEVTLDPDDHAWAADLQDRFAFRQQYIGYEQSLCSVEVSSCSRGNDGGGHEKPIGLYRWEEGIGEWVERTPVPCKMKKTKTIIGQPPSPLSPVRERSPSLSSTTTNKSIESESESSSTTEGGEEEDDPASSFTSCSPSEPLPLPSTNNKRGVEDDSYYDSGRRTSKRLRIRRATMELSATDCERVHNTLNLNLPHDKVEVVVINPKRDDDDGDISEDDFGDNDNDDDNGNSIEVAVDELPSCEHDHDELWSSPVWYKPRTQSSLNTSPCLKDEDEDEESEDELNFLV